MEYRDDKFLDMTVRDIISSLNLSYINPDNVKVIRSIGSKSRRTLARIHTISKAIQMGLKIEPAYVIEVISENFDPLSYEEKVKTLIHEILHIPKTFGGGFRHHKPHVNKRTVDKAYKQLR